MAPLKCLHLKCFGRAFRNIIQQRGIKTTVAITNRENKNDYSNDSFKSQTHFGFQTVDESEKSSRVHEIFENVASSYDVMNDSMSLGIHRIWKDILMHRLSPSPGIRLLDVGGGTGDIAFRLVKYLENIPKTEDYKLSHVTVSDINQNMLDVGLARAAKQNVLSNAERINCTMDWIKADAECLPFPDSSYSAFTIAFCIRNVTHIQKVLEEAYRVLQPGGRFLCLEFSRVDNDLLRWFYDQYSFQVIPVIGQLVAGQWKAYQYLVESIRQFPPQEEFKEMIEAAGFRQVSYENLTFGVVAIHSGFKL